jgi:tetratricopeptide (TPR) repeat protein
VPTAIEQLALGNALHTAGRLLEAEQAYMAVLAADFNNAEAHYRLGMVRHALGEPHKAVISLQRAVESKANDAALHHQLGIFLAHQNRLAEAIAAYRTALTLRPDYVAAHGNLGNALWRQGKLDEAAACYRRIVALDPTRSEPHMDLGNIAQNQERFDEAIAHFRRALELNPYFAEGHRILGMLYLVLEKREEAIACFRRAIELRPDFAEAYSGLGSAHGPMRLEESEACFRQAIALNPSLADVHYKLGVVLDWSGQLDNAIECQRRAIHFDPGFVNAQYALGLSLLMMGRFSEGWPQYEWRFKLEGFQEGPSLQPCWTGGPLAGKTILLHSEQGLGDALQFIRYAKLVKQQAARVVVNCQPTLARLVASCPGVDAIATLGQTAETIDIHVTLGSLPGIFGTTLETIPAEIPYLSAPPGLVDQWRLRLGEPQGFRVGIFWQGNPLLPRDQYRSIPLTHFRGICRTQGVQAYSLQVGAGCEQLRELGDKLPIIDLSQRSTGMHHTAAIMQCLDLVITIDSAPAHLAGALGVPVWVALSSSPEWRWMLDREDSPWYPTMRLFRQSRLGDWDGVFRRFEQELAKIV